MYSEKGVAPSDEHDSDEHDTKQAFRLSSEKASVEEFL
jgi:hypothetical protein